MFTTYPQTYNNRYTDLGGYMILKLFLVVAFIASTFVSSLTKANSTPKTECTQENPCRGIGRRD